MSTLSAKKLFSSFNNLHVFVIGDVMLDNYWLGDVHRISPEAPVPIFTISKKEKRLGGAANVALNCKAMGAKVSMLTVIGNDDDGKTIEKLLKEEDIEVNQVIKSKDRITTSKTRVMCKNQQMIRLDEETLEELNTKDEHHFIDICMRAIQIEVPDVVIFEDYNKGVLKKNVIEKLIAHCKTVGIITTVDPKNANFFAYKGVTIFKPNLKEAKEALYIDLPIITKATLKKVHKKLHDQLEHDVTLITLSEHGVFSQKNNTQHLIPAHVRNIADVSGAGDTVIAIASMTYAISKDEKLSAQLANLAGGLVCEEVGVVAINKQKLFKEYVAS
jgi:rfaE bifunctional protein kinase chain/domain